MTLCECGDLVYGHGLCRREWARASLSGAFNPTLVAVADAAGVPALRVSKWAANGMLLPYRRHQGDTNFPWADPVVKWQAVWLGAIERAGFTVSARDARCGHSVRESGSLFAVRRAPGVWLPASADDVLLAFTGGVDVLTVVRVPSPVKGRT